MASSTALTCETIHTLSPQLFAIVNEEEIDVADSMDHEEPSVSDSALLNFGEDMIAILVGPDKTKFTVHLEQLKKSPYFENATKKPWLEDRTIHLPVDDPEVVHSYLHFLYASTVPAANFEALSALYVFGEKVVDLAFKNTVIEAIINLTNQVQVDGGQYYPVTKAVDDIYAGTLDGSPGRRLLVDIWWCYGAPHWIGDHEYDAAFLRDLVLRRMRTEYGSVEYGTQIIARRYLEQHDGYDLIGEATPSEDTALSRSVTDIPR